MRLGVAVGEDNWDFFHDVYAYLSSTSPVEVFRLPQFTLPILNARISRHLAERAMARFLHRCDVAFFEWASDRLALATSLPKVTRIVTRLHSFELYAWAPQVDWEKVDTVILVSFAMQRRFCALYPAAAGKTCVVYYGKSMDEYRCTDRPFSGVLGMLCSLLPIKRVYEVILAFGELASDGFDLTLRLGGPPGQGADAERYNAAMQRLVHELGLQDRVSFDGRIAEPARFLREIDIFVSNSFWEGQQNALLEAMASGCYCLSHIWDGADEVLPPEYLFVTDGELRAKVEAYCRMPESERQVHRARMRAIAEERFDIRNTCAAIGAILEEAARR